MADYQLTDTAMVIRNADQAFIPDDPANGDRAEYDAWLADGGVPDPYVEPDPAPPTPTAQQEVLYDHENRLRYLEGEPPLSFADFVDKGRL